MPRQAALKFETMTVPQLLQLRDKVQSTLSNKIEREREELQRRIDELSNFDVAAIAPRRGRTSATRRSGRAGAEQRGSGRTHPLKGRVVAPKYRDPKNPSQTWAGRGLAPKWLTAYEQEGRKREEFLVGATSAQRTKRARKQRRS